MHLMEPSSGQKDENTLRTWHSRNLLLFQRRCSTSCFACPLFSLSKECRLALSFSLFQHLRRLDHFPQCHCFSTKRGRKKGSHTRISSHPSLTRPRGTTAGTRSGTVTKLVLITLLTDKSMNEKVEKLLREAVRSLSANRSSKKLLSLSKSAGRNPRWALFTRTIDTLMMMPYCFHTQLNDAILFLSSTSKPLLTTRRLFSKMQEQHQHSYSILLSSI